MSFKNLSSEVLLVIGKTGTGKSSLCNRISGHPSNSEIFPVSGGAVSCTQNTVLCSVHFNGESNKPVGLIDTIGFDDPNNDTEVKVIADLVDKLKNGCDYVNLFGIAVNGQSPRLDGSLVAMIRIFEEMFGEQFWKQCVLIFTRMSMDKKNKRLREKNAGKSDDDIASEYVKEVEKKFPNSRGRGNMGLRHLFLDACFDEEDEHEEEEFKSSMDNLYKMLSMAPRLNTSEVNENVRSEHGKLKRKIEENERQRKEELAKHAKQIRLLQKEAEEKRQEDLRKLEEQTKKTQEEQERKHCEDIQKLIEETERKRQEDLRRQARETRKLQEETESRYQENIQKMQHDAEKKRRDDLRRQKEEIERVQEEGERERRHQEEMWKVREEERRRNEEQQEKRLQSTGVDQVFIFILSVNDQTSKNTFVCNLQQHLHQTLSQEGGSGNSAGDVVKGVAVGAVIGAAVVVGAPVAWKLLQPQLLGQLWQLKK